jgi:hypothetical protein
MADNDSFTSDDLQQQTPALDATRHPSLRGVTTAQGAGVVGVNHAHKSLGLLGGSDRVFHQGAGVYGESEQQGVFGHGTAASGTGVYGNSAGAGFGVRGDSTDGVAVQGQSFGGGIAVQGIGGRLAGRFQGDVEILGKVRLVGDMEVTGDLRFTTGLADVAEAFAISAQARGLVEPGTVMCIGDDGALAPCQEAYDRRAAGVITGAGDYRPGLLLDGPSTAGDRLAIALVGKVFCKVDARTTPIAVGDLLTPSDTPGHAMRASDRARSPGAIIGKALGRLEGGTGLIPILVALQ